MVSQLLQGDSTGPCAAHGGHLQGWRGHVHPQGMVAHGHEPRGEGNLLVAGKLACLCLLEEALGLRNKAVQMVL